jgi:hypothetical protein
MCQVTWNLFLERMSNPIDGKNILSTPIYRVFFNIWGKIP